MSLPVCPSCGRSDTVAPDPSNGGAGRNRCRCGHTAPVRDFHRERAPSRLSPVVMEGPKPGEPVEAPRKPQYWWQED